MIKKLAKRKASDNIGFWLKFILEYGLESPEETDKKKEGY